MDDDFDIPAAEGMMNDDMMDLPDESPILKVGEEKEIGKQGLKKKLLKEGEGWDTPDNGDKVERQVIKGWDLGIKTMKKNENAIFTIPAELAYGESGSPTIPPYYVTTPSTIPINIEEIHSSSTSPNTGSNGSTEKSCEYQSGDKHSRCSVEEISSPQYTLDFLNIFQERTIFLKEELSFKKQVHADRCKISQRAMEVQLLQEKNKARKLEHEKLKLQMDEQKLQMNEQKIQMDRDMLIMSIDLNSSWSDAAKEQILRLRSKILAKWEVMC